MSRQEIKLGSEISDIIEFVQKAGLVKGDVTVQRGIRFVDGKSLLGMMSIDHTRGESIIVEFPEEAEDFKNFIRKFSG